MDAFSTSVTIKALYLVLLLSAPPVLAAMIVGLIISLLQATTQVQEQTLTFVPKMVTVILVIAWLSNSGISKLINFTLGILEQMPKTIQ